MASEKPLSSSIVQLFDVQAARTPDADAVVLATADGGTASRLSYQELGRRAEALARALADRGVGPGHHIAIYMDRALETVVGMLGILKAGAAYVPLDSSYPADRLAFMLKDTAAAWVLTQSHMLERLPKTDAETLLLDADWGAFANEGPRLEVELAPDSPAYVIYTSGSTGQPKGVCVPHRGVVRLVRGTEFTPLDDSRVFLQLAPISFDAATLEIWGPLLNGGRCVLFPSHGVPDFRELQAVIEGHGVTTLWLTASLFNLVIDQRPSALRSVPEVLAGGEALSVAHIRRAQQLLPNTQLINGYGPTESTTFTTCYRIPKPLPAHWTAIPLGTPIANTQVYILDDAKQAVTGGEEGTLYIGGLGLASEYLNRPELTAARFQHIALSDTGVDLIRVYDSGDRAAWREDGTIEFRGRTDDQVKVRGYRIELGEIESALLEHQEVREAAVLVREDQDGDKSIVAYVVAEKLSDACRQPTAGGLRTHLSRSLPDYMVPGWFVLLDAMPLTANGKLDRRALPAPGQERPELGQPYLAPRTKLERLVAGLWREQLNLDRVGVHDKFFELGGTSLKAVTFVSELSKQLDREIPIVIFFDAPTVSEIARVLSEDFADAIAARFGEENNLDSRIDGQQRAPSRGQRPSSRPPQAAATTGEIAIIGMSARVSAAADLNALWRNLRAGVDASRPVTAAELAAVGLDPALAEDPDYVKRSFTLEDAENFDARFFGYTPREAELMDPQQRLFLELAYTALEDAGYDPSRCHHRIGVFGGVGRNAYLLDNIASHPRYRDDLIAHALQIGNERDFPSTHVAYKLDLRGPAINVQTACSTSGVAVHLACQSLRSHDAEIALVGGCKVLVPVHAGYPYVDGGALAADGTVRAFDAKASGMVRGSGGAFIVLKPLASALADGDTIRAIIKGSAINNDGAAKIGFTAPSVQGQAAVIRAAHANAGVTADQISYIETHGTGTVIGDPMEVAGLTKAFRASTERRGYCAIGSVKTNIGHLDAGATVAGIVKTVLALEHQELPPSLGYDQPNPRIDFETSPFFVNATLRPWPLSSEPRRAGVSSFGLGGTNAHVVLQEAPTTQDAQGSDRGSRGSQLILLSAVTETALDAATDRLGAHLRTDQNLADAAYTLAVGRKQLRCRRALVAVDSADAAEALAQRNPRRLMSAQVGDAPGTVVFMFPGGGAQYPAMGRDLYHQQAAYRDAIDRCARILEPSLGRDLRTILYGDDRSEAAAIEKPSLALPTLMATEYALAMLWRSWGVEPAALIGHSMGEYAAACISGLLTLEDALALVSLRGQLFEELPAGSMLSVPLGEAEARRYAGDALDVAAANKSDGCVLSGPVSDIERVDRAMSADGIESRRIHIDVAAHSRLVEPILERFASFVETVRFGEVGIPFVSNVTGTWVDDDVVRTPAYWCDHLRHTVRFADGLATLYRDQERIMVEVGPGQTLSTFARQHPDRGAAPLVVPSLRHPKESAQDLAFIQRSLGRLWAAGSQVDWDGYYGTEDRRRVPLPTYPFERARHWIDRVAPATATAATATAQMSFLRPPAENAQAPAAPLVTPEEPIVSALPRKLRILEALKDTLSELSGLEVADIDEHATFLELGFDSLFLTQANAGFRRQFGIKTSVRQLIESMPYLDAVAEFIDGELADDAFAAELAPTPAAAQPSSAQALPLPAGSPVFAADVPRGSVQELIAHQLQLMQQQLAILTGTAARPAAAAAPPAPAGTRAPTTVAREAAPAPSAARASNKDQVWRAISEQDRSKAAAGDQGPSAAQREHIDRLIEEVCARAPKSKELVQRHRAQLADPRSVQGFTRRWKEMVFPIVAERSKGSKLWDIDGNEYIDLVNGYGVTILGHSPDFVTDAVREQLERGVELGPQNRLVGELAALTCELTGMDRAAFCNTGSEAVLAALRLARTVTGNDSIVTFKGHYHGIFDEVLGKGITVGGKRKSMPIAPGIPSWKLDHNIQLDYGDMSSLDVIREHADDIALVMVEPVRSRNPAFRPVEFMRALRNLTRELDIPLLFDEMVTGFRCHLGGAQAYFGIEADLATYGKVVGGGYPIGVLTGRKKFMDALDGGYWQYGDDSVPDADMTWFAGTFVRHPVAMAAAFSTLSYLKEQGPSLQQDLAAKTEAFADELNTYFAETGTPIFIEHFAGFFVLKFNEYQPYSQLLFYHLHNRGVFTYEGRPAFFTTAHSDADYSKVVAAIQDSVRALQRDDLLAGDPYLDQEHEIPLAEGQQEIWLATRFGHDASCAFNLCSTLDLRGELDLDSLRRAVTQLVRRHQALRCVPNADGHTQRVMPANQVEVPLIDLSGLSREQREERIGKLQNAEVTVEMNLDQGPLYRFSILRLAADQHRVLMTVHHLIADGWSCGVLCRDLGKLYAADLRGETRALPAPMRYSEWIESTLDVAQDSSRAVATKYWVNEFGGEVPVLELPTDRPRPALKTFTAGRLELQLDRDFSAALRKMCGKHGATLFAGTLAGFHALLYRLSGQSDLVVGFSLAGQANVEGRELVGHCVNFLPLRAQIDEKASFADHLKMLRGKIFDAFDHQNFTFGTLVKNLDVERDPSRTPLVSVAFNLDPSSLGIEFHDLECTPGSVPRRYENLDIFFNLVESDSGLEIQCTYNRDLWDPDTMERRLAEYKRLLEGAVADPNSTLAELPMVPDDELERILVGWNRTEAPFPERRCLHQLLDQEAERGPERIAVRCGDQTMSYGELIERANQLGNYLQSLGVEPDQRVAICMRRRPELLVALLGTLKAGGAYVPISPDNPRDRVAFMLEDCGAQVVLTESAIAGGLPASGAQLVTLDAPPTELAQAQDTPPPPTATASDLAYVNYTSGSTGRPKGVAVEHRALIAYLSWSTERYHIAAGSGAPVHSSIGFDLTITSLWGPLYGGKTVDLIDDQDGVDGLATALASRGNYSLVKLTPAHLTVLEHELQGADLAHACEVMVIGGEQLTGEHIAFLQREAPGIALINEYGPTETVVGCCIFEADAGTGFAGAIPIGKPAPNCQIYLLDRHLNPVGVGVPAELYIGGAQLARGYLNRPQLTAERFITNPFSPEQRLYRTGDLARWRTDGNLQFLGRTDSQVKIRGYRIELGEVEATLAAHEAVKEAVVLAVDDRLAAYLVAGDHGASLERANQKHAADWNDKWDALYAAGAEEVAKGAEQLDDLVLLKSLSDKGDYEAEVKEGLEQTFDRLRRLPLKRVYAIGCGSGAVIMRLAPLCGQIFGTDYSAGGIDEIHRLLSTEKYRETDNLRAEVRPADDFSGIEAASYTTVMINSVCQYFPSGAYLKQVLEGAVRATAPGGIVFLGDVQSYALLAAHHAIDQLRRSAPDTSTSELRDRIAQRIGSEEELVVDPGFFRALAQSLSAIGHIELRLRRGEIQNETTRFHYDVWLHVGPPPALVDGDWHDWSSEELSVSRLSEHLREEAPETYCLAAVPNSRLQESVCISRLLADGDDDDAPADAAALLEALNEAPAGVDPMKLWALAKELPYDVDLRWTDAGRVDEYDVVFRRRGDDGLCGHDVRSRPASASIQSESWWTHYASIPMRRQVERELAEVLRADLAQSLPDYMVPASFTILDALPLTTTGKVDHAALLATGHATEERLGFVAPSTPLACEVAGVWAEVLRIEQVGLHDNFFELGGHSLLGIQVVVRLRELLEVEGLSLSSLFETPTVDALSERIEAMRYLEGASTPTDPDEDREEFRF